MDTELNSLYFIVLDGYLTTLLFTLFHILHQKLVLIFVLVAIVTFIVACYFFLLTTTLFSCFT